MLYANAVLKDIPSAEDTLSVPDRLDPYAADDRDPSQAWRGAALRQEWPAEVDRSDQDEGAVIDLRVFRPEVFDAVWPRIVGVRADLARKPLGPAAWRRLWLNGYAHLRACDPGRYAATAYGLDQAIAVLAPVVRRIEADFRQAGGESALSRSPISVRHAPSSATLARWLREEAGTQLPTRLPKRVSEMPIGSLRTFPGPIRP
jgi:hypothetical protein